MSTEQSSDPEAKTSGQSAENAQLLTIAVCAVKRRDRVPFLASHSPTVLSAEQEQMLVPAESQCTSSTAFL